jgi:hypothetical protein
MNKIFRNNWVDYWARFSDAALLQRKSANIDSTLLEIEKELDIKLLSGDQLQVIDALEERLKSVKKRGKTSNALQTSLFE